MLVYAYKYDNSIIWIIGAFPPFQMGSLKPFLCQHQIVKLNIWKTNVLLQPFLINMNK
jgi:hypothetical protein